MTSDRGSDQILPSVIKLNNMLHKEILYYIHIKTPCPFGDLTSGSMIVVLSL